MMMLNKMTSPVKGMAPAPIALMGNSKNKEKHPVSMANLISKWKQR